MKELYKDLLTKLETLVWLHWIDLDKGQLSTPQRPDVAFPCCLIKITGTTAQTVDNHTQLITGTITMRIVFDLIGNTASQTPQAIREESLLYLDKIDQLYTAINGKANHQFRPYEFISQNEQDSNGLRIVNKSFKTHFFK